MYLMPDSITENKRSITKTHVLGARNSATRELRVYKKTLQSCISNDLNFGTSNPPNWELGYNLSNNRSFFLRLVNTISCQLGFETCPERGYNINNKVNGILQWPQVWFSFALSWYQLVVISSCHLCVHQLSQRPQYATNNNHNGNVLIGSISLSTSVPDRGTLSI